MIVSTSTAFDLDAFNRGYEEWDINALLALYTDEVELIQIDRDNPPSAPRVQGRRQRYLRARGRSHRPRAASHGGRSEEASRQIARDRTRAACAAPTEQEVENAEGIEANRFRA